MAKDGQAQKLRKRCEAEEMYPIKTAITLAIIDGRYQFGCERRNCQSSLTHVSSCPDVYEQCSQ
eukprot:scaffold1413_cov231-Chaetoceros_neogracile.AAC.2